MKRYKTVFVFPCGNGHQNLFDSRIIANTPAEAVAASVAAVKKAKCRWCDAVATGAYQIMGSEEISLYEIYDIIGYTCHCGEKVEALRAARGNGHEIPMSL